MLPILLLCTSVEQRKTAADNFCSALHVEEKESSRNDRGGGGPAGAGRGRAAHGNQPRTRRVGGEPTRVDAGGSGVHAGVLPDEQEREMLVRAAYKGSDAAVEQLLAVGVDPDATASFELRYNSAELDLEDISMDKDTALTAFAYSGHIRALELMLVNGADIEKTKWSRKDTPYSFCLWWGYGLH